MKDFVGTKVALVNKDSVLVVLRDDKPGIDFPGMWDLPGGAREVGETPFEVAAREIEEELGINLDENDVIWRSVFPAVAHPGKIAIFMVAGITESEIKSVELGDEGQRWRMMGFTEFLNEPNAVPGMKDRLRAFIKASIDVV